MEYCSRTAFTQAEEYQYQYMYAQHGGVQARAGFHVENESKYWKWDHTEWTPFGNSIALPAWDSHVIDSAEVRLYFRHLDPTGRYWEYGNTYEYVKPFWPLDCTGCLLRDQGVM